MDPSLRQREPVALLGAVSTVIPALLALLVAFGVDLTEAQTAAILGVLAAITAALTGVQRNSVYPAQKVDEVLDADSIIVRAEGRVDG